MLLHHKFNTTIIENTDDYITDFFPDPSEYKNKGIDVLSFRERSWCSDIEIPFQTKTTKDNVAVAEFDNYENWFQNLKCETRARIKRAARRGLITKEVLYSEEFAYGVLKIFNETKIRQGRRFTHYGESLDSVKQQLSESKDIIIGAFDGKEAIGFIQLAIGDCTGQITQILSLEHKRDMLPNNALIAKAVEVCANHNLNWLIYARMGNHPSLDEFKRNNGFKKVEIKRHFVPLTTKGKVFLLLGLQKNFKDSIPNFLKPIGFKLYNFVSRICSREIK
jgi:hypothetical protein